MKRTSMQSLVLVTLFVMLTAIYLASGNGGFHNIDEVSIFALTESIAKRGSFDANSIAWTQWALAPAGGLLAFGSEGDVYAKKGPAPAFLAVPFYLIGLLFPSLPMLQTTLWYNAVVTSLTAMLVAMTALNLGYCIRTAMLAGLVYGLGTMAFPYARQFFGEPTAALALLCTFYGLLRFRKSQLVYLGFAGFFAGMMIATNAALGVLLVPFGLYMLYALVSQESMVWKSENQSGLRWHYLFPKLLKSALVFGLPLILVLALLALYNFLRFANPFMTGYHFELGEGFTTNLGEGLWGLIASPYKGFFWFNPLAFVSLIAIPQFLRRHWAEGWLLIGIIVITIVLFAKWWMWWGPLSWGPRFLVPLAPVASLLVLPLLDRIHLRSWKSNLLVVLLILSILVQLLAVSANYLNFESILAEIYRSDWYDLTRTGPPALYNPLHSPILGQVWLLLNDPNSNLDVGWISNGEVAWEIPILNLLVIFFSCASWYLIRRNSTRLVGMTTGLATSMLIVLAVVSAQVYSKRPEFGEPGRGYVAVLNEIDQYAGPEDGIVTIAPFLYQVPMTHYRGRLPIYGYSTENLPLRAEIETVLSRALIRHPRVWLVTVGLQPASPENGVEAWLSHNAFKADERWFDDARLVTFVSAQDMVPLLLNPHLNKVRLLSAKRSRDIRPGGILAVELEWQVDAHLKDDLNGFVQILTADGHLVVGNDGIPGGGYLPTTTWKPGVPVTDRRGIVLPSDLPPGDYVLIAGIRDAVSGERLRTSDGQDHVVLERFTIR